MGFFSKLFSSTEVAKDVVNATISTGDKLFYTDEEKADNKKEMIKFFPTLLKSYTPFRIAQRVLAIIFSILFSLAFLMGIGITIFNIVNKYIALSENKEIPPVVEMQPLFDLVTAFSLDWIMLAIVSFYFAGGTIESISRHKEK